MKIPSACNAFFPQTAEITDISEQPSAGFTAIMSENNHYKFNHDTTKVNKLTNQIPIHFTQPIKVRMNKSLLKNYSPIVC